MKNGEAISTEPVNPQDAGRPFVIGSTLDQRFDDVASLISAASTTACQEVSATYDATDGHPLNVYSGTALKGVEDGFGAWTISSFTGL